MPKIWINKAHSFEEAEAFDREYYASLTPSERLEILQALREEHFEMERRAYDEAREGLRRAARIAQYP